mmetsp:Transcript_61738/g.85026  ORF Transcript_61738/g.85026 Transcript_61738/m.85026 type:complete len:206 (+) Transcript_61738:464-1081(+)
MGMNPEATADCCWAGVIGVIVPEVAPDAVLDCRSKRAAKAAAGVPQEEVLPNSLPSAVLNPVEHVRLSHDSCCFHKRASGGGSNGSSNTSGSLRGVLGWSTGVLISCFPIKGAPASGGPSICGVSRLSSSFLQRSCAFSLRSCASSRSISPTFWLATASSVKGAWFTECLARCCSARCFSMGARGKLCVALSPSAGANRSTRSLC